MSAYLEFSNEKNKKHPSFHFSSSIKNTIENEMVDHDFFLLQHWAIIVFGILALLSHNQFSYLTNKECFNYVSLIYLTCDFCTPGKVNFPQSYFS